MYSASHSKIPKIAHGSVRFRASLFGALYAMDTLAASFPAVSFACRLSFSTFPVLFPSERQWIQENPLHTLASEMRDLLFSQYFQQSCCLVIQSQQIVLSFFPDRKHFPVFLPENLIMEHLIPLGYPAPCAVFVS